MGTNSLLQNCFGYVVKSVGYVIKVSSTLVCRHLAVVQVVGLSEGMVMDVAKQVLHSSTQKQRFMVF
jgi:hypothetical protein